MTVFNQPFTFNLWEDPWIGLQLPGGEVIRTGIREALCQAHRYAGLYDTSPLAVVAVQRLLAAVLQDAFRPQETRDLRDIRQAGCFSPAVIDRFGKEWSHRFDLFSEREPFMQSADLSLTPAQKDPLKTVAYLSPEFPSGTAITHYHHKVDQDQYFCPACVAVGLASVPAFATSGGAGIKPSINGVPPLYILPAGRTLFDSLLASLILPKYQPSVRAETDQPWWTRPPKVNRGNELLDCGYIQSLTFPARRIRLHPLAGEGVCTRCGDPIQWGVRTMVFEMGECRPKDAPFWQDPFAAYHQEGEKPPIPVRPSPGKAAWREYAGLFLRAPGGGVQARKRYIRPTVVDQADDLQSAEDSLLRYRCVGMRTDMKAKVFEWVDTGFDVPLALIKSDIAWLDVKDALEFASECLSILVTVFRKAVRRPDRYSHQRSGMVEIFWLKLALPFRELVLDLPEVYAQTGLERPAQKTTSAWEETTVAIARQVFSDAIDSIGTDGPSLRIRVQSKQDCFSRLSRKVKEKNQYD